MCASGELELLSAARVADLPAPRQVLLRLAVRLRGRPDTTAARSQPQHDCRLGHPCTAAPGGEDRRDNGTVAEFSVGGGMSGELLIAANPDPDSKLPYLLRLPLNGGMVFRTSGTWPRVKALYCHPVGLEQWPDEPEIVQRTPLRSCVRRGAAIDLVLDRARENRSQIVFTIARGREMVFWQSARTRKQARPQVTTPTARAAGLAALEIAVDTRERYGYRFASQQVTTVKRALPCGDYAVSVGGRLAAAVERKSLSDLASSLLNGTLRYALGELAALPRAAVVVEDRYSAVFKLDWVRPALVADGLAELQIRWANVPIVFTESRSLAEEWVYRYLAAAHVWATDELAVTERLGHHPANPESSSAPAAPEPTTSDVRAWARTSGLVVPARGRLNAGTWAAWHAVHSPTRTEDVRDDG